MKWTIAIAFLFLASPAHAQELPDWPGCNKTSTGYNCPIEGPNVIVGGELPEKPHPVVDREFWITTGALAASYAADIQSTDAVQRPDARETNWLLRGSQSTPKIAATLAAYDASQIAAAYFWKRYVTNKYLHPLWRGFLVVQVYAHISGTLNNRRYN